MQANHWSIQLSLTTRSPRWRLCTKLVNPFLVPLIIAIIDSSPALSHGACVIKLSKSAWKTWTSITFHKPLELKLNKFFPSFKCFVCGLQRVAFSTCLFPMTDDQAAVMNKLAVTGYLTNTSTDWLLVNDRKKLAAGQWHYIIILYRFISAIKMNRMAWALTVDSAPQVSECEWAGL